MLSSFLLVPSAMRSPLHDFLSEGRRQLLAGPVAGVRATRPTLVLGNMAGDLDTVVTSIVLAYCRHGAAAAAGVSPLPLIVPLIPFARREFRLRQDVAAVFAHCAFELDAEGAPTELMFADELLTDAALAGWRAAPHGGPADEPFELVLTDHNRLDAAFAAKLGTRVVAIVDHHSDESAHLSSPTRQIDTGAGSASSLVSEMVLLDDSADLASAALLPIASLLLSAISVDTRGFAKNKLKFSARDVRACHRLLSALGSEGARARPALSHAHPPSAGAAELASHAEWLREAPLLPPGLAPFGCGSFKALSRALLDARFSVRGLSVGDLLSLDYKQTAVVGSDAGGGGVRCGVSAVFVPLTELISRAGGPAQLQVEMGRFAQAKGVEVVLALCASDDRRSVRVNAIARQGEPQPQQQRTAAKAAGSSSGGGSSKAAKEAAEAKDDDAEAEGDGAVPDPEAEAAREAHSPALRALLDSLDLEWAALKTAALAPALGGGERAARAAAELGRALERAPAGLPPALVAEPLYGIQRIPTEGFGFAFRAAMDGAGGPQGLEGGGAGAELLRISKFHRAVTRKTVLPAVAHILKEL